MLYCTIYHINLLFQIKKLESYLPILRQKTNAAHEEIKSIAHTTPSERSSSSGQPITPGRSTTSGCPAYSGGSATSEEVSIYNDCLPNENNETLKRERDQIVLFRRPFLTLEYFFKEIWASTNTYSKT